MKYGFSFLMIVMAFPSCNQSSSSNHGVEYHPLLVEIADTYCSIYAEPAELAIDIMDLRAEHHDALSSGDLSCTERKKLVNEMGTLFMDFKEAKINADAKIEQWSTEEELGIDDYHLLPLSSQFCPEIQHSVMVVYNEGVISNNFYGWQSCDGWYGEMTEE